MNWRSTALPWVAAALSGALLSLCYPNWDHGVLVWFWQAPLLAVLWFYELPDEADPTRVPAWMSGPRWRRILCWPLAAPIRLFELPAADNRWVFGLRIGYVSGFTFFALNLWWIGHVSPPGVFLLVAYLAIYFGLWGAFAATAGRLRADIITPQEPDPIAETVRSEKLRQQMEQARKPNLFGPSFHSLWVAFACSSCWVALEWLRGWLFTGFGWNGLGVALHNQSNLIQIADVVGVTGLSFLPVFCTCVGFATVARFRAEMGKGRLRPHIDFGVAMIVLILTFFYSLHIIQNHRPKDPVELDLVLVQGNIPVEQRWSGEPEDLKAILRTYHELTASPAIGGYDLIVWPETSLPHPFFWPETEILPATQSFLDSVLGAGDFQLILGNEDYYPMAPHAYNGMFLLSENTEQYQAYHKMHLVPFGEFVPFRRQIPPLHWALKHWIPYDFARGAEHNLLNLREPDVQAIPTICFEDTLGRHTRRFVSNGADKPQFILNLTNDAWFRKSPGITQHVANAKFRCIELRRPMARCANTGVSCVIDEFGIVSLPTTVIPRKDAPEDFKHFGADGSNFRAGAFPMTLRIDSQPVTTIYAKYGDWFSLVMLAITALIVILRSFFRRHSSS